MALSEKCRGRGIASAVVSPLSAAGSGAGNRGGCIGVRSSIEG